MIIISRLSVQLGPEYDYQFTIDRTLVLYRVGEKIKKSKIPSPHFSLSFFPVIFHPRLPASVVKGLTN